MEDFNFFKFAIPGLILILIMSVFGFFFKLAEDDSTDKHFTLKVFAYGLTALVTFFALAVLYHLNKQ